jgi:hypothetical protein
MRVGGVDYRDVEPFVTREETGGRGEACGTGADDNDIVACRPMLRCDLRRYGPVVRQLSTFHAFLH